MDEQLLEYFIEQTNRRLDTLTEAQTALSRQVAGIQGHFDHIDNLIHNGPGAKLWQPGWRYHAVRYGLPSGIATAVVVAWEAVGRLL